MSLVDYSRWIHSVSSRRLSFFKARGPMRPSRLRNSVAQLLRKQCGRGSYFSPSISVPKQTRPILCLSVFHLSSLREAVPFRTVSIHLNFLIGTNLSIVLSSCKPSGLNILLVELISRVLGPKSSSSRELITSFFLNSVHYYGNRTFKPISNQKTKSVSGSRVRLVTQLQFKIGLWSSVQCSRWKCAIIAS